MEQTPQTSTQKPEAEVKSGAIVGTIWKNEGSKGPFYTITVIRFYKDRDDKWKRTKTLRPKDMPDVIALASQVTAKIAELSSAPKDPGTDAPPETSKKTASRGRKANKTA